MLQRFQFFTKEFSETAKDWQLVLNHSPNAAIESVELGCFQGLSHALKRAGLQPFRPLVEKIERPDAANAFPAPKICTMNQQPAISPSTPASSAVGSPAPPVAAAGDAMVVTTPLENRKNVEGAASPP